MSDKNLNPNIRKQVQGLRETIFSNATNKTELPSYYTVEPIQGKPRSLITDIRSGRSTEVSLCDLRGAIQALSVFSQ